MSLPWFPLYANDFVVSTVTMSPASVGSYIRLLCYAWTAGSIPNDYEVCSRIAVGMTPSEWNEIRHRFEVVTDPDTAVEKLVNPRMERERERTEMIRDARREAAARTNAKRWGVDRVGDRSGDRVADGSYSQSHSQHTTEGERVGDRIGKRPKHDAAAQLQRITKGKDGHGA